MGFFMFMAILVGAILALVGGLRLVSGERRPTLSDVDPDRLERLEAALASLDARLGDVEDQQRFLEQLLADRPALGPGQEAEEAGSSDGGSILFDTGEGEGAGG